MKMHPVNDEENGKEQIKSMKIDSALLQMKQTTTIYADAVI